MSETFYRVDVVRKMEDRLSFVLRTNGPVNMIDVEKFAERLGYSIPEINRGDPKLKFTVSLQTVEEIKAPQSGQTILDVEI
jgi:tRNA-dihydrouridine synthase